MLEFQIDSINKPDRMSPHEHITHLGYNPGLWKLTRASMITRIDGDQEKFFTLDKTTGKKVYIFVVRGDGNKAPYVRTHADGKWQDNLLALPECDPKSKVIS